MARHRKKIIDITSAIALFALIMLDMMLWRNIFLDAVARAIVGPTASAGISSAPRVYPLPLARGASSTLLMLPNGVTVLTDAGSDAAIVDDLQKALPSGAPAYVDLAIISAPQTADYEGYQYLLAHYDVGAFLYNGRADIAHGVEWTELINTITAKHIPLLTVGAGDRIHYGTNGVDINILTPDTAHAHSPNASDTAIFLLYNKQ